MDSLRSLLEFEKTASLKDVESLVKSAKTANVNRQDVVGFALENDDGSLVKVFVKRDQAEEFEVALSKELYNAEQDGIEIAEMLFNLRQHFDIMDVEWGENSIPEDEEQTDVKLNKDDDESDDTDEDDDADEDLDSIGDEDDQMDDLGNEDTDDLDSLGLDDETMPAPDSTSTGQEDIVAALGKVLDMLKADAEARQAEAKAKSAEAEVKIAQEANKAASMRAAQEEEVLDMEDYNKRQDEEKKMADTRDKLIKYRHDLKKQNSGESKIGESMDHMNANTKKFPDATPEEEEILDMEEWEKKQKEEKKNMSLRDRLMRYRHAKKKGEGKKEENEETFKDAVRGMHAESLQKIRSLSFSKFNMLVEKQLNEGK